MRFLDLREETRERAERSDEEPGVEDESDQISGAHGASDDLGPAVPEDGRRSGEGGEGNRRDEDGHDGRPFEDNVQGALDLGREAAALVVLPYE